MGRQRMSTAVLLVGHGTRDPVGCQQFFALFREIERRLPGRRIQPCFLEHAEPSVPAAIDRLVQKGTDSVAVVPLFFFAAGHAKVDLPRLLAEAGARHPHLTFHLDQVLGVQQPLVQACQEALERLGSLDSQTWVLLVGRGSSDPEPNMGLAATARWLWESTRCGGVEIAFSDVTEPRPPAGFQRCVRLGARRIILLPYFLFQGVLMERLHGLLPAAAGEYPAVEFAFAGRDGLAAFPSVVDLITRQVEQAIYAPTSARASGRV